MPSQRINDNQHAREREKQVQDIRQRHINGQQRGDLKAPDKGDPRYNYKTYHYDYFTGPQVKVYMGDIWVDDIVTIQYNTVQNKEPIYGYASQNFDAVAMGTVLGQGTFTIAFKEVGYLNVIKALLDQQKLNVGSAKKNVEHRLKYNAESEISSNARTSSSYAATINKNFTPSLIRRSETIEDILDNLKGLNTGAKDLSDPTGQDLFRGEAGVRDFEDIAEIMEDTIWGDSNGKPFGNKAGQMLRADQFDHNFKLKSGGATGIKTAIGNNYTDTLNIMVAFGDLNDFRAEHTIIMLNDVHFTGQGMLTAPNGDPIAESYQFFFRDINQSISQTVFNINPIKFSIGTDEPLELSKLKDVETFTKMLDDDPACVSIKFLSKFTDGSWTPEVGEFSATDYLGYTFRSSDSWGRAQALNNYIEEALGLWYTVKPFNERPDRVAIEVLVESQVGSNPQEHNTFNYILDKIGDTSLYKVTSPTKDDFTSLNLVRREDFFLPVPPPPEPEEAPIVEGTPPEQTDFTSAPGSFIDPLSPGAEVLNPSARQLLQQSVESLPLEGDLLQEKAMTEAEQLQAAIAGPGISSRDRRDLQRQLEKQQRIDADLDAAQRELSRLSGDQSNIPIVIAPTNKVEYTNRDPQEGEIWVGVGDTPEGHRTQKSFNRKKDYTNLGAFDYVVYKTKDGKHEEVSTALNLVPGIVTKATRGRVEIKTPYAYNDSLIYVKYLHVDGSSVTEGQAVDRYGAIGTLKESTEGKHLHTEFFFKNADGEVVNATPTQAIFLHNELINKQINTWQPNRL